MNTSSQPLPASPARIAGGIYGALVGDALGVPVEFSDRAKRDLDPVAEMRGWGTWNQKPGTWSDDGALLLASTEALCDGWDLTRMAKGFVAWRRGGAWAAHGKVFDIGATTAAAIDLLADGCPPELAGGQDEHSNGNGSLMRILPVALHDAAADDATLMARAMAASSLTHGHIRAQLACGFYCLVARRLLAGKNTTAAYESALDAFIPWREKHPAEATAFARIESGRIGELSRHEINSGGYVIDTLEAALWCLLRGRDFSATVLAAVNLGGDTDTTGCVTGGLAGCLHGVAAIPGEWRSALPQAEVLDGLVTRMISSHARQP